MGQDDTDRDGDIIGIAFVKRIILCGCFDHNQPHIIIFFKTASFVDIQRVGQKVDRYFKLSRELVKFFLFQWGGYIDPGTRFGAVDLNGLVADIFEVLYQGLNFRIVSKGKQR
jgi:hypothetical protein